MKDNQQQFNIPAWKEKSLPDAHKELKEIGVISAAYDSYYDNYRGPRRAVDKTRYNKVCKTFYNKLSKSIITTGEQHVLPSSLGYIQAVKYKLSLSPEKQSKRLQATTDMFDTYMPEINRIKRLYATNFYRPYIRWKARKVRIHVGNVIYIRSAYFKNSTLYKFELSRGYIRSTTHTAQTPDSAKKDITLNQFFMEKGWEIYDIDLYDYRANIDYAAIRRYKQNKLKQEDNDNRS